MYSEGNLTAFILCGGKSKRMEKEKGIISFEGMPFVLCIINALKPITNNIKLITGNNIYRQFGYPLKADIYPDKGPVGGIFTALSYSETDINLILSCDIPLITTEILKILLFQHEQTQSKITIAEGEKRAHPLIGIYSKEVIPTFKACIQDNELKLFNAIKKCTFNTIKIEEAAALKNVNTVQELNELTKISNNETKNE
ncbi:MAG: molybdenum cofactor guanylyltransferase [Bacteroidota bacterium]